MYIIYILYYIIYVIYIYYLYFILYIYVLLYISYILYILRLYHTSEGGGTGWNCKKFDGNRWNHKDSCYLLAATYYTPPVFSRAILPLPFSGISSSLLFHLSSSILLSDLFFSFSFSFFHE